jgi:hypothetical protein
MIRYMLIFAIFFWNVSWNGVHANLTWPASRIFIDIFVIVKLMIVSVCHHDHEAESYPQFSARRKSVTCSPTSTTLNIEFSSKRFTAQGFGFQKPFGLNLNISKAILQE